MTIVGRNKIYDWGNLIRPFLAHKPLGPRPAGAVPCAQITQFVWGKMLGVRTPHSAQGPSPGPPITGNPHVHFVWRCVPRAPATAAPSATCAGDIFGLIFESNSTVNMEWFKFCICELTCSLKYLHEQGYYYGDLKPENVLLTESGSLSTYSTLPPHVYVHDHPGQLPQSM